MRTRKYTEGAPVAHRRIPLPPERALGPRLNPPCVSRSTVVAWKKDKPWLSSLEYLVDIFSKMEKVELATSRKRRTGLVASDKIRALKQKLEFCKICIRGVDRRGILPHRSHSTLTGSIHNTCSGCFPRRATWRQASTTHADHVSAAASVRLRQSSDVKQTIPSVRRRTLPSSWDPGGPRCRGTVPATPNGTPY